MTHPDELSGDVELRALELELAVLPCAPRAELRARVLADVRAASARRARSARAAGLALALAAAALLITRPLPLGSEHPPTPGPSLDALRAATSGIAAELGLDPREETRLALLALGRAALPRVAPVVRSDNPTPPGPR